MCTIAQTTLKSTQTLGATLHFTFLLKDVGRPMPHARHTKKASVMVFACENGVFSQGAVLHPRLFQVFVQIIHSPTASSSGK